MQSECFQTTPSPLFLNLRHYQHTHAHTRKEEGKEGGRERDSSLVRREGRKEGWREGGRERERGITMQSYPLPGTRDMSYPTTLWPYLARHNTIIRKSQWHAHLCKLIRLSFPQITAKKAAGEAHSAHPNAVSLHPDY